MANTKQTVLSYTEKEIDAINVLKSNKGAHLTLRELGIAAGTMTSLRRKAQKVADGELEVKDVEPIIINVEDAEEEVMVVKPAKKYYIG